MLKSKMLTQLIEIKAICQRRRLCQGFTSELNYLTFLSSGDFLKYSATQAENIDRTSRRFKCPTSNKDTKSYLFECVYITCMSPINDIRDIEIPNAFRKDSCRIFFLCYHQQSFLAEVKSVRRIMARTDTNSDFIF